ncbi:MAG: hypothetical protein M3N68_14715 [Actinomycetota bacterium]|nr:hypothetical protein [Actinomycetota bacterium]
MAIITSMLVMMVVVTLGLVSVQLSAHQGDQTALDRRRLQAVDVAEAGLNYTVKVLATTATASLPCGADVTGALAPAPSSATYRATVTYYASYPPTGVAMACPLSQNLAPRGALVRSTGTVAGRAQGARTMESLVRLDPVYGAFTNALLADNSLTTLNSFVLEGNNGNDADVYSNGNWTCSSSPTISGSVNVQGSITMSNSCTVAGDVWANGSITMNNTALAGGDATSSTAGLSLSNNSGYRVDGKATVLTSVDRPAKVRGGVTTGKSSPPPPRLDFPVVNFVRSQWEASGYTVQTFTDCAAAKSFIAGLSSTTTKYVVRITSSCTLSYSSSDAVVNLGRDLAVVTDGSFTVQNSQTFQSTTPPGSTYDFFVIVPYTTDAGTAQTCAPTGTGNITLTNQTRFNRLKVAFYTPCTANVANFSRLTGQIVARTINVGNNFHLKFSPVLIPGGGQVTGNRVDIAFVREVRQ